MRQSLKIKQWKDPKKIYGFAIKAHSKKALRNKHTWIYNLRSLEVIKEVIKNQGKYYILFKNNEPVSIISIVKGFEVRPLNNYKRMIHKDAFEIGAMLTDKKQRGKGYSKILFDHILKILKKKKVKHCYVLITGTYNIKKKGTVRDISKPVENICKEYKPKLIGYTFISYGPIYRIKL